MEAMETLVWVSLNAAAIAIRVAWVAFFICFGAWAVIFNRRFAVRALEERRRTWKWGYSEREVRFGRVMAVVVGSGLVIGGLMQAAEFVLS